jgi:outer membrane beta-barrel protein
MRTSPPHFPLSLAAATALALSLGAASAARAADAAPAPDAGAEPDQVIVPQVERRDVHKPHYPSNDFQGTLSIGGYSAQEFGASGTAAVRLAYHLNEDWFGEASYGQVKIGDQAFRNILPGGVLERPYERLQTYDLSVGYNLFSGEAFFGTKTAKAYQMYVDGGIGNTIFNAQRMQTWVYGVGARLFFTDSWAIRLDMRNHLFKFDLLGQRELSQHYEFTLGGSYFF